MVVDASNDSFSHVEIRELKLAGMTFCTEARRTASLMGVCFNKVIKNIKKGKKDTMIKKATCAA